jgi:hypothetical protein
MIRYQPVEPQPQESKKGLKPKPVTRPKGKDAKYVTSDIKSGRGGYKTR